MIRKIFLKELKDTLRDRRTLMTMLVIPMLLFPVIINIFIGVSSDFEKNAATKPITIGIAGDKGNPVEKIIKSIPDEIGKKKLIRFSDTLALIRDLKKDSIQIGIYVPKTYEQDIASLKRCELKVYHNVTEMGMQERAEQFMAVVQGSEKLDRLKRLNLDEEKIEPLKITYVNIASEKEMIGKLAGGMLPYIFIVFGFIGCMYPAIDLFTGEKERGTIETLLTTPVTRWQILIGKMGVVVLSGLTAATCALLGLFVSIETLDVLPDQEILKVVHSILSPGFIVMLYCLLIPLTIFFAGVMIPICIHAKTFKEAQSIITPLNIVMVLPAMVGFFPGIELNWITASIPVVNVVLATKELIAGTLEIGLISISFLVMISLAGLAVLLSYRRFDKETNVLN
ncbi:MAG: ABC transporter permease [Cryomorphaceae bacterium]|jgi:sodium transport system permease protein|nr:ABC transporter permease [Cryomorphaceae bacterium]